MKPPICNQRSPESRLCNPDAMKPSDRLGEVGGSGAHGQYRTYRRRGANDQARERQVRREVW